MINNKLNLTDNTRDILDIRSERLFREAEDDVFFFYDFDSALEKLNLAIEYTPAFTKALLLKADILVIKGEFDLALNIYHFVLEFGLKNAKVYASIANCYELLQDYEKALIFIEKSFAQEVKPFGELYKFLYDLKVSILVRTRKYYQARLEIDKSRYNLFFKDYLELKQSKKIFSKHKRNRIKLIKT